MGAGGAGAAGAGAGLFFGGCAFARISAGVNCFGAGEAGGEGVGFD